MILMTASMFVFLFKMTSIFRDTRSAAKNINIVNLSHHPDWNCQISYIFWKGNFTWVCSNIIQIQCLLGAIKPFGHALLRNIKNLGFSIVLVNFFIWCMNTWTTFFFLPLEAPAAQASGQRGGKRGEQRGWHAPPPITTISEADNKIGHTIHTSFRKIRIILVYWDASLKFLERKIKTYLITISVSDLLRAFLQGTGSSWIIDVEMSPAVVNVELERKQVSIWQKGTTRSILYQVKLSFLCSLKLNQML